MPRVSVVMPARNPHPRYFHAAVRSILDQTFDDLELIVVETEGESAAAGLLREYGDARVRRVESQRGIAHALNAGIAAARADLIARIDADDIAMPDRLAEQVAMFSRELILAVAGSQSAIIDDTDRVIATRRYPTDPDDVARTLMRYNCLCHPSVMFRRAAIMGAGGYAEGLNEDYDLWCRLAARGAVMRNHSRELVQYRFHESATRRDVRNIIRSTIEIKRRNFGARLDFRARLRIAAERALIVLPERAILALFRRITYSSAEA